MRNVIKCLVLIIVLFMLVGCEGGKENKNTELNNVSSSESETEIIDNTTKNVDYEVKMFTMETSIEETVLVDEEGVKITATKLDLEGWSPELTLVFENNSGQDLSFIAGSIGNSINSINGYMIEDGYVNIGVADGKKANEKVTFDSRELSMLGITEIATIMLGIEVIDDNYNEFIDPVNTEIRTSISEGYDYSTEKFSQSIQNNYLANQYGYVVDYLSNDILYDEMGIKVISHVQLTNNDGEQILFLEVENTTDKVTNFKISDIEINGLTIRDSTWISDTILPNKKRVIELKIENVIAKEYWDIFGIEGIGRISYSAYLSDEDDNDLNSKKSIEFIISSGNDKFDESGVEVYNSNDIRIVSKGIIGDISDYSDEVHVLFLVENNGDEMIDIGLEYDSVSVNGFMVDDYTSGERLESGETGIIDVVIWGDSLEENDIGSIDDIGEVEMQFEINDRNYTTIDNPVVKVSKINQ